MDDLISRNAALALVVKAIHGTDSEEIKDYLCGGLRKELWALPSAQPEIIRCRECRYNDMPPTAGNAGCTLLYGMTNQNGFCSLAERREVDDHETD